MQKNKFYDYPHPKTSEGGGMYLKLNFMFAVNEVIEDSYSVLQEKGQIGLRAQHKSGEST